MKSLLLPIFLTLDAIADLQAMNTDPALCYCGGTGLLETQDANGDIIDGACPDCAKGRARASR